MDPRNVLVPGLRVTQDAEPQGVQAGFQATIDWQPAVAGSPVAKERQAVDLQDLAGLGVWRIAAITRGTQRVFGRLIYGTSSSFELGNIILPLVAYVPGNAQLYLLPEDTTPAARVCVGVSAKLVGGFSSPQIVRTFHTAGATPLPSSGYRFTALAAATLTVEGVAGIAVAAGDSLRITSPSILTAGSGLVEHEL